MRKMLGLPIWAVCFLFFPFPSLLQLGTVATVAWKMDTIVVGADNVRKITVFLSAKLTFLQSLTLLEIMSVPGPIDWLFKLWCSRTVSSVLFLLLFKSVMRAGILYFHARWSSLTQRYSSESWRGIAFSCCLLNAVCIFRALEWRSSNQVKISLQIQWEKLILNEVNVRLII